MKPQTKEAAALAWLSALGIELLVEVRSPARPLQCTPVKPTSLQDSLGSCSLLPPAQSGKYYNNAYGSVPNCYGKHCGLLSKHLSSAEWLTEVSLHV